MAKLEQVTTEIMAEAHKLRHMLAPEGFYRYSLDDILAVADSLTADLENIDLPALVAKHQRRGELLGRAQYARESRNKGRRRARARAKRLAQNSQLETLDWHWVFAPAS